MCRQIRTRGYRPCRNCRKRYTKYENLQGKFPGDKVQVDIKYVPDECIRFPTYGCRYYQITAIDEYSRKRVLKIVKEKSTYETAKYLKELEARMGFEIHTIQVDNGKEFVHDEEVTEQNSSFEEVAKALGMIVRRIRPYSPWQNGKVERSHREDGKILYSRNVFFREKDLLNKVAKHERRYNKTAKRRLGFRSPNRMVEEYFSMCNKCLDT